MKISLMTNFSDGNWNACKIICFNQLWLFQMGEWAQTACALWIPALLLLGNALWFRFKGSLHFSGDAKHVFYARTASDASESCWTWCSSQGVCPHTSKNSYGQSSWVPHEDRHLFLLGKAFFLPVCHIMEYVPFSSILPKEAEIQSKWSRSFQKGKQKKCAWSTPEVTKSWLQRLQQNQKTSFN